MVIWNNYFIEEEDQCVLEKMGHRFGGVNLGSD